METWAQDPAAIRKRVYFEGSSTIYAYMPVCYNYDTTDNWTGASVSATGVVTETGTTAEGLRNEGKFIRVENPTSTNLLWFAGVVAPGSYCNKAGPATVDVIVPNGAIVPVRCGMSTTTGRTVLSIGTSLQYFGNPLASVQGRPVAIAEETVTGTTGTPVVCLARLCPDAFLYQTLNGTSLLTGTGVTTEAALTVNRLYYASTQTDGDLSVLKIMGEIAGAGGSTAHGVLQAILKVNSASQGTPSGLYAGIGLTAQTTFATGATGTGVFGALRVTSDNQDSTPATVSGADVYNIISDLNMNTNAPQTLAHMYFSSDGTADPAYWFVTKDAASVGYATTSNVTGMAHIPVYIGGVGVRYILLEDTQ